MRALLFMTLCGLLALPVLSVRAEDLGAVQARMRDRIAKLAPLKIDKTIGENNAGLLEVLKSGASAEARQLAEAENADRRIVYAAIAAKTGASAAQVARQRAKELAERSAPGMMVQGEDGTWSAKR